MAAGMLHGTTHVRGRPRNSAAEWQKAADDKEEFYAFTAESHATNGIGGNTCYATPLLGG